MAQCHTPGLMGTGFGAVALMQTVNVVWVPAPILSYMSRNGTLVAQ